MLLWRKKSYLPYFQSLKNSWIFIINIHFISFLKRIRNRCFNFEKLSLPIFSHFAAKTINLIPNYSNMIKTKIHFLESFHSFIISPQNDHNIFQRNLLNWKHKHVQNVFLFLITQSIQTFSLRLNRQRICTQGRSVPLKHFSLIQINEWKSPL